MKFMTVYCVDDDNLHGENDIWSTDLDDARYFATLIYGRDKTFWYGVRGHKKPDDYEFNPDDFIYPLTVQVGDDEEPSRPFSPTNFGDDSDD